VCGGCTDLQRDEKKPTVRCREDNARVGPSTFHLLDDNLLARLGETMVDMEH